MPKIETFSIRTSARVEFVQINDQVQKIISESGLKDGLCCIYVPHTTAAVTINEGADPSVVHDIALTLNKIVPLDDEYTHQEGNSAAHIKTSLIGTSELVIVEAGRLNLGTWQSIFFCEFDGPRSRKVWVKLV